MDIGNILQEWGWFIAAGILILLEILAPGVFFLFFAFAAFIVAGISWAFNIGWQYEVLLFSAIGIASMYLGRRYFKKEREKYADHPINDPMAEYLGKEAVLQYAIVNGVGKIKINGLLWGVKGDDAKVGTVVKLVAKQGDKFIVELV